MLGNKPDRMIDAAITVQNLHRFSRLVQLSVRRYYGEQDCSNVSRCTDPDVDRSKYLMAEAVYYTERKINLTSNKNIRLNNDF